MTGSLREISCCEVCGNDHLESVLDLGSHPMCDDLVKVGHDRRCKEYPIEILFCSKCATAHQRFQIPKEELFPTTYHYRSRHTADVLEGMRQLVAATVTELGPLDETKILDIGCNDGSLLSTFRDFGASRTFGIEPTGAAEDARERGHEVINAFLTEEVAERYVKNYGPADIITFTNVFAHIEDLHTVIRSLLLLSNDGTTIIIENHYLGSVLEKRQFDTFYHEHPRTYSYSSFAFIAESLKRRIANVEFPKRYGGNIRVMMRTAASQTGHESWEVARAREASFGSDFQQLASQIEIWKGAKGRQIEAAFKGVGKLSAKAFPGRSAIPVKLLGLEEGIVSAVYEKPASGKIGHYVPGTRIPIRSDDEFDAKASQGPILNMAWHIASEIGTYMRSRGYTGELIDIISPMDFVTDSQQ
jgi:Putative zinc binding domain/Methyltransferase domain/C-methyltransferase C-terminal domain